MVGVAQLVRAPGCGPGGRRFKSGRPPFLIVRQGRVSYREWGVVDLPARLDYASALAAGGCRTVVAAFCLDRSSLPAASAAQDHSYASIPS